MDVKTKMNDVMVEFRREDKEYNTFLLGKKEMKELKEVSDMVTDEERVGRVTGYWSVDLIEVKMDSFCEAVYITRKVEE